MKKGIYLIADREFDFSRKGVGVYNKIKTQVSFFEKHGYSCQVVNMLYPCGTGIQKFVQCFDKYLYRDFLKVIKSDVEFIYVRHIRPSNAGLLWFFEKIKKEIPQVKIIYEIPTFPYDNEVNGLRGKVGLAIDKLYREKLKKYVDIITTYSEDNIIWGIPTLQLQNGVDCASIPVVVPHDGKNDQLRFVAVAQFSLWHGYDRLLEGINLYKNKYCGKYNIEIDLVGDGPLLNTYQKMVEKYDLNKAVHFHGLKSGQELTDIFNNADIAVCSLGCHRKNLFLSSELKSREYLARGLPIVTSTKIDVVPDDFPYCLRVPEDDSPIDINAIISFYESNIKSRSQEALHLEIRKFAEEKCDMDVTMKPVLEFI